MNLTEKIVIPTEKGVAEKMIHKPKKTLFFTVDQENIYFGDAIEQNTYFNILNQQCGLGAFQSKFCSKL